MQSVDPLTPLLQYGAVGAFAITATLVAGFLGKRWLAEYDRLRQENADLKSEVKHLNTEMQMLLIEMPRAQNDLNNVINIARKFNDLRTK